VLAREMQGSERALEGLQRISAAELSYMPLEGMLYELLERIRRHVKADTAAILLLDRERGVLVARAACGIEEVREGVQVPLGRGFAGRVATEGHPIIVDNVEQADIFNPMLREHGLRSLLGVPLLVGSDVIGVMHIGTVTPRKFNGDDIRLMQLAAERAAHAIDNAQMAEQRSLTAILQRTLLPATLPSIPGLTITSKYLAAESGIKLGGDWHDVFTLPDGRVAFVIGDVVGRGVVAACVMAEVRSALRAYAMEHHDLATIMSLLNELLLAMGRNRSATVAIFALDLETKQLCVLSAGHLPALLLNPDGEHRQVGRATSPPLGVSTHGEYHTEVVTFEPGSALLMYTDGLVERRGELIDDGLERLGNALRTAVQKRGTRLANSVFQAIASQAPLEDDVAMLAVQSLPLGSHLEMKFDASPDVLASLRRVIARWLAEHQIVDPDRFDITLACSEAAANAIEHAYGPREASFGVDCGYADEEVCVNVSDEGTWRPLEGRERGRGLMMMHELMDSVDVDSTPRGTVVTLRKHVGVRDAP
jgi:serine phosphatase RsbU (regulator of sigma subunit)/anti-sigma regulatory factor (Ser/Thr protein kinase)